MLIRSCPARWSTSFPKGPRVSVSRNSKRRRSLIFQLVKHFHNQIHQPHTQNHNLNQIHQPHSYIKVAVRETVSICRKQRTPAKMFEVLKRRVCGAPHGVRTVIL